jgi:hypothetical protein
VGGGVATLLFDFVVDALAAILDKANLAGHISGVVAHLILGGITHLQYVDDTIILRMMIWPLPM